MATNEGAFVRQVFFREQRLLGSAAVIQYPNPRRANLLHETRRQGTLAVIYWRKS